MADSANNRGAQRKATRRDGVLVVGPGHQQIDCTVTDISTTGAGIKLSNITPISDTLHLIVMAERRAYAAMVMWRKPGALGLKFVSVIDLGKLPSRDLNYLNRVWMERSGL